MLSPARSLFASTLRLAAGLLFVGTGGFKLLGTLAPGLPAGAAGFAVLLEHVGVPFPLLAAYAVCQLELGGGLLLCLKVQVRAIACLLAIDMACALGLVGLPALLGHPVQLGSLAVGQEPWRVPLELGLLAAMGYLGWHETGRFAREAR